MIDEPIEVKNIGKYRIKLFQDMDPQSPREDDNLGKFICFHKDYNLGEKHDYLSSDYGSWGEMSGKIFKNENAVLMLNLFLYDHSGITIATTPFGCRWDSGQVGFAVVTREALLKEYGGKYCTKKKIEKARKVLEAEVKTYDQYLTGDVYGYEICEVKTCELGHEHEETVDDCWGYYGQEDCMSEAESIVSMYLKEEETVPA